MLSMVNQNQRKRTFCANNIVRTLKQQWDSPEEIRLGQEIQTWRREELGIGKVSWWRTGNIPRQGGTELRPGDKTCQKKTFHVSCWYLHFNLSYSEKHTPHSHNSEAQNGRQRINSTAGFFWFAFMKCKLWLHPNFRNVKHTGERVCAGIKETQEFSLHSSGLGMRY